MRLLAEVGRRAAFGDRSLQQVLHRLGLPFLGRDAEHAPGGAQRRNGEAVPALLQVARNNKDPEVRKAALFWLGQSGDPRATDLFEQILR